MAKGAFEDAQTDGHDSNNSEIRRESEEKRNEMSNGSLSDRTGVLGGETMPGDEGKKNREPSSGAGSPKFLPPPDIERKTLAESIIHVILTVVCFVLIVVLVPFFLPISLIFRFYRRTLVYFIRRTHKNVEMVSGPDSVWLQDSKTNPAVINSIIEFKGKPKLEIFKERIMERLVEAKEDSSNRRFLPKVKQYASTIFHRYVWIDDEEFDIDKHMFIHDQPAPDSREDLQVMVGELCSTPLPERRPMWQFIIIKRKKPLEGETPEKQTFYVVFRVHHSIADGISLVKLLVHKIVDKIPEGMLQNPKRFGSKRLLSKALKAVFEGPVLLVERLLWPADNHLLHKPITLSGQKLVAWSDPVDLGLVKQIKNATSTTVNDVLVSCMGGAFGEYFRKYSSEIPTDMKAYVPVDIRPASQTKLILDNEFSLVFLSLPVNVEDPLEALFKVKARMDKIKTSPEPIITSLVIKYAMARLPNWVTQLSFDWLSDKCTMVLSNVPGPQEKLAMAGQELDDMLFWPPQRSSVGLGVSLFSYGGHVRVGVLIDKTMCTNPNLLTKEFNIRVQKLADQLKIS